MRSSSGIERLQRVPAVRGEVSRALVATAQVVLFAALTFLGANIVIPLFPVPITLQTLFVLLAGAMIGARKGAISQMLYVGAGAIGLPAFAGGASGLAALGGPTAGYLLSFMVVPLMVGACIRCIGGFQGMVVAFVTGTIAIFILGIGWLAIGFTHSLAEAIRVGLLPFVPGAVLKAVAAVSILHSWQGLRNQRANRRSG